MLSEGWILEVGTAETSFFHGITDVPDGTQPVLDLSKGFFHSALAWT